ncbi:MAG: hypothetical protein EXS10_00250 [Phycisphaerales bacterium]|nr:hypothetical protein [Phycisphaerales bacterium]
MPTFRYQSIGADGAVTAGSLSANDRAGAVRTLTQRGETALTMHVVDGTDDTSARAKRRPTISRPELADFIREVATALEAGLPLMSALRVVHKQAGTPKLRAILDYLIERVEAGVPLYQAAKEYGAPFDDMTVGMLRAADATGRTSEVLHQLADLLERSVELRREVVGAVIYPAMVAGLIAVSVVIMIVFVLPRIMAPILASGRPMPLPTEILLGMSGFVAQWWYLIIAVLILAWYAGRAWYANPDNRLKFDTAILRFPVVGRLLRDIAVARFTRTLGTLVSAGIPILSALRIVRDTLGNHALMHAIDQVSEKVTTGQSLADPLERCGLFPPLLVQIVNIGERSGRLEQMLMHAAGSFDRQVNNSLKLFTRILPSFLLVIMAVVAVFVLAAILLPILELQQSVG